MKMTDGENLIAYMLADLIAALHPASEIEPEFIKTAISDGNLWALKTRYHGILHEEEPDPAVVEETGKLMTVCRVVENSIARLSPEERATIPEHAQTVFVGFDGNEEPHYGVALMLVNHMNRFAEWAERGLNSHHPTLDCYRRMQKVLGGIKLDMRRMLDLSGIKAVLDA